MGDLWSSQQAPAKEPRSFSGEGKEIDLVTCTLSGGGGEGGGGREASPEAGDSCADVGAARVAWCWAALAFALAFFALLR